MSLSDTHSDAANNDQPLKEEVASTFHSNSTSVANNNATTLATQGEDSFENDAASKVEKDIEILEVKEYSEECLIDLTTLLEPEENPTEDGICITKIVHNKGPLAEYMAKRKKHKHSDSHDAEKFGTSSSAKSSDICSMKDGETQDQNWYSSDRSHHSRTSDTLLELLERGNENSSHVAPPTRPQTPPTTSESHAGFCISPTYKRKMKPFKECFEGYRAGCFQKPIYSELPTQEKRKHSSIDKPIIIIDLSSSNSEENSPCSSWKKSKKTLTRHWEWSDFGLEYRQNQKEYPGVQFSIMSYNLLAQDLLEHHPHLYSYCDWQVLPWEYRRARLLKEIDKHLPDIMCLQEVQCDHYEDFLKPKLEKRGYLGIYCQKSGLQTDGCATFFKVMKFELLNFRQVFYEKGGVLDRCNVGLIVSLKPQTSDHNLVGSELYIANTHLLFNPRRGDVKLAQLILLLAELDKAAYKCHQSSDKIIYHPTILCGDFNLEPFCRIYKLIVSQYLRYAGLLIREMAGMSENHFGRDAYLSKDFFPPHLNITNSCQFAETVKERNLIDASKLIKESSPVPAVQSRELKGEPSSAAVHDNSPQPSPPSKELSVPPGLEEILKPMSSGEVSHFFNFVSTYRHVIKDRRHCRVEVTTYHDRACETTDYIFYNVNLKSRSSKKEEGASVDGSVTNGRLKLLCRYGLFSTEEVRKMDRLPNAELGSDHFSLLAHFLLT